MERLILIVILSIHIAACSYGGMKQTTYDSASGKYQTIIYSKYFDKSEYLIDKEVGIQLVVDAEKREIPGAYELKKSIGALGPDDLSAHGVVTVYVYNLTDALQEIEILEVEHFGSTLKEFVHIVSMQPNSRNRLDIGAVPINSYATELEFTLRVRKGSEDYKKIIIAKRLSQDELRRQYGKGGKPDHPWLENDS